MRVLLDTHIALWAVLKTERLASGVPVAYQWVFVPILIQIPINKALPYRQDF